MDKATIKTLLLGAAATFLGTYAYNQYMSKRTTVAQGKMTMSNLKISTTVILSLLVTGAALNVASSGYLGGTVKDAADFIIKGYGV